MSIVCKPKNVVGPVSQMLLFRPAEKASSPSLVHKFVIFSVVMQYSMIKSSVSATMTHLQSYMSSMIFLKLLFLSDCVISCLVSCFMLII